MTWNHLNCNFLYKMLLNSNLLLYKIQNFSLHITKFSCWQQNNNELQLQLIFSHFDNFTLEFTLNAIVLQVFLIFSRRDSLEFHRSSAEAAYPNPSKFFGIAKESRVEKRQKRENWENTSWIGLHYVSIHEPTFPFCDFNYAKVSETNAGKCLQNTNKFVARIMEKIDGRGY